MHLTVPKHLFKIPTRTQKNTWATWVMSVDSHYLAGSG